jgi:hypothetical protein
MKNKLIAFTLAGLIMVSSSSCFVLVRGKKPHHRRGKVVIVSQKNDLPADSLILHPGMLHQPLLDEISAMNSGR